MMQSHSKKVMFFILIAMCVLVLYQNCGQSKTDRENPNDDKVKKIDAASAPSTDSSEDELINDLQKLTVGVSDEVAVGLEECRRSMGSDRRDCIWDKIVKFYAHLKNQRSYEVSDLVDDCYLAVSKSSSAVGNPIDVVSTCKNESAARDGGHVVHLDECLDSNRILAGSAESKKSALLLYKRSRYFEHTRKSVSYKIVGSKNVSVLKRDISAPETTDACQNKLRALDINLSKVLQIN